MKFLIVIDVQKDFVNKALGTKEAISIVPNVVKKIKAAENDEDTVVLVTKDTHDESYMNTLEGQWLPVPHCIHNTDGWELNKEIQDILDKIPENRKKVILKNTFGYLKWEDVFKSFNENIENYEIEVCGLCTDICVISNVLILRAIFPNVSIKVDTNACAGVTVDSHESALKTMQMCDIQLI